MGGVVSWLPRIGTRRIIIKYLAVPGTELKASNIWLGTASFGSAYAEGDCFRILDRYLELGGNVIDTANIYASWLPDGAGKSELTVGKWLRQTGARDRVLISTKGGHPDFETMHVSRLSHEDIKRDLSQNLDRLGIEAAKRYAAAKGLIGFCCSQINFSLAAPNAGFDFPGTISMLRSTRKIKY